MRALPPLGLGCAAFAVLGPDTDDAAVASLLDRAFTAGIRYIDTAPLYGGGRAEDLIGRALAGRDLPVAVSTKVGYAGPIPYGGRQAPGDRRQDFSRAAIEAGIAASLRRLRREYLDIVFLHDPGNHLGIATGEAIDALERLRDEGVIGAIGVGTTSVALAAEILTRIPLDVLLLAGRYTLVDRSGLGVLDTCAARGVAVITGGVFNSGLLAVDRPALGGPFDYAPAPPQIIARAAAAHRLCEAAGVPLKAAALQFARRHPAVAATLLGPRTLAEFDELLAQDVVHVPEALWADLDAAYDRPEPT